MLIDRPRADRGFGVELGAVAPYVAGGDRVERPRTEGAHDPARRCPTAASRRRARRGEQVAVVGQRRRLDARHELLVVQPAVDRVRERRLASRRLLDSLELVPLDRRGHREQRRPLVDRLTGRSTAARPPPIADLAGGHDVVASERVSWKRKLHGPPLDDASSTRVTLPVAGQGQAGVGARGRRTYPGRIVRGRRFPTNFAGGPTLPEGHSFQPVIVRVHACSGHATEYSGGTAASAHLTLMICARLAP